uniref:F-box and leucine-rich protein 22 n=1 Tax=Talaromyces marneffei PM1 TaxID=1077442 RepID=A0A093VHI3_TALMA
MVSSRRVAASAAVVETPSRPVRSSRRQITSYNESSSPDSSSSESHQDSLEETTWRRSSTSRRNNRNQSVASASSSRPKRTVSKPRTYQEPSSDEDLDSVIARYPEMIIPSSKGSQSVPRPSRVSARQRQQHAEASPSKRKRTPVHSPRKRRHAESTMEVNESAPPWPTLPYQVLLSIFMILFLLSQPNENLSVNYPTKVQEVFIDVRLTLVYKAGPTYGYFDLCKLIQKVPHIKTLRLLDSNDGKQPLWADRTPRWNYPSALFETLKATNIHLHTFDWNTRYMETRNLIDTMLPRHLETPFQSIRSLNIFHVHSDEIVTPRENGQPDEQNIEKGLGEALCQLPDLQAVSFTDCGAVNDVLLAAMPSTLRSLTLDNCDEAGTVGFMAFLTDRGSCLRQLVLKHNRHLNMSFMTILRDACPNLEKLSADFIMHNWPPHYDGTPHFKNLIKPGEIPTWPRALQEIELSHLRQLDEPQTATFLSSLVDAATDLPNLRKINISATVWMQWQDRASFRKYWGNKLARTFLRKDVAVTTNLGADHASPGTTSQQHSHRHSARIARQRLAGVDDDDENDELEEIDHDVSGDDENKAGSANDYVQGLCDVVSFGIDGLRPTENQYSEGDFLDSEQSGDEDWEGEDWEPENDRHAW